MVSLKNTLLVIFLFLLILGQDLSRFCERFAIIFDSLKSFDRAWHIFFFFLFKLPSYGFHPTFCTCISSFLFDGCISVVVDYHCSKTRPIRSIRVCKMCSVLSPTLFLLFIKDITKSETNPNLNEVHAIGISPINIPVQQFLRANIYTNN